MLESNCEDLIWEHAKGYQYTIFNPSRVRRGGGALPVQMGSPLSGRGPTHLHSSVDLRYQNTTKLHDCENN